MRITPLWASRLVFFSFLVGCFGNSLTAQPAQPVFYALVDGSQIIDDCPVCDRLAIVRNLRGTFQLRFLQQGPLFSIYSVENISFTTRETNAPVYTVKGQGTYRVGGEVGLHQDIYLEVTIDNGSATQLCTFTNAFGTLQRLWPMLEVGLDQTNGTLTQQFHLDIAAAPFRELWFSTTHEFHSINWNTPTNLINAGDLISSMGRVVKRNQELTLNLGIMPVVPDLGLKDIDILAGGEIAFSIETNVWSEALQREIRLGDIVSDAGRLVRTNQELLSAFVPQPPTPAAGLHALQFMDNGEIYFTVHDQFFSEKLGSLMMPGDLLSDRGALVKSQADLLGSFGPTNKDFGLNSVYVWPSGEIWFSTRDAFYSSNSNYYASGDLLSDQGYVVYRNSELLSLFQPVETNTSFGLDALFVVSDVTPGVATVRLGAPQITNQPPASLALSRLGGSRIFQLESAPALDGPFTPIGPLTTDSLFLDPGALTNFTQRFYRLHQW